MAYDAIRDTHLERSPSVNLEGHTPHMQHTSQPINFHPSSDRPSSSGRSYGHSPSTSRPGSSSGTLRGILNETDDRDDRMDRYQGSSRSSGSFHGQSAMMMHRGEYAQPSIGSVMNGAPSPSGMTEGRNISMLLNGPGPLATPASTPGGGHSSYPYPSPSITSSVSPRFGGPMDPSPSQTMSGGYPFPSVNSSGLYHPQHSPTFRARPLPPAMNPQTGFPSAGYHPSSEHSIPIPSPSPSAASIHNLLSPSSGPYRSPSLETRSIPQGLMKQPIEPPGRRRPSATPPVLLGRSSSGSQYDSLPTNGMTGVRSTEGRRIASTGRLSMDHERNPEERRERRSSIQGWNGEVPERPPSSMTGRTSLANLMSPSNEDHHQLMTPRREPNALLERGESVEDKPGGTYRNGQINGVVDLSSPTKPRSQPERETTKAQSIKHSISPTSRPLSISTQALTDSRSATPGMMDMDLPDGASALDVLASLSERAGTREKKREGRKMKEESAVPSVQVEEQGMEESVSTATEIVDSVKTPESESDEASEMYEVDTEPRPAEDVVQSPSALAMSPVTHTPSPPARAMSPTDDVTSSSGEAAAHLTVQTPRPRAVTPVDLAAQIFPEHEVVDVEIPPEPSTLHQTEPSKTEYKPLHRLTAPLSVLEPISQQEMEWYLDARNALNPLRKGCPVRHVTEGKDRLSGPPRQGSMELAYSGRKRGRESPSRNGFEHGANGNSELDDWGYAKRARRGPLDALNERSSIAAHYNSRGNTDRSVRSQSKTFGLKVCNNWIKSVLIKRFTKRRPGVTNFDPDGRGPPNGRVLDMGCGKGGDIDKWNRAKIADYIGIDIASGSIDDFKDRLNKKGRRISYKANLFVLDCFSHPINLVVPRHLLEPKFDTLSMQFCMHYAFETEKKVRQMLSNVSGALRIGGVFLGTTLSAPKILDLLAHIPEDSDHLEIGNPYFKIIFEERHHEGVYGHAYRFSLEDAVEDCIEWIVYWEEFETLAKEYGLKLLVCRDFDEFYEDEQSNPESVRLAETMHVTSNGQINMDPEQWSACSMYRAFAFIKLGDAPLET